MDILLNGTKGCPSSIILKLGIVIVTVLLSYNLARLPLKHSALLA